MSFGNVIKTTAVMIVTSKLVNEGFEAGKKKIAEFKEKRNGKLKPEEQKQVDSVTQLDEDEAPAS